MHQMVSALLQKSIETKLTQSQIRKHVCQSLKIKNYGNDLENHFFKKALFYLHGFADYFLHQTHNKSFVNFGKNSIYNTPLPTLWPKKWYTGKKNFSYQNHQNLRKFAHCLQYLKSFVVVMFQEILE